MKSALDGIIAVAGSYGSGKTEVSVNLAMRGITKCLEVSIADLDLVNP
jgi:dephospho-CoA kinase